jgi:hypothetical protein
MDESDFRDLLFGGADCDIDLIGRRTEPMQTAHRRNEDDRVERKWIRLLKQKK